MMYRDEKYKQQIIKACQEAGSMREAASKFTMNFETFRKLAKKFGCYKPNPGRRGLPKPWSGQDRKLPLSEILEGKHPQYRTHKLHIRLLKEGIKQHQCEKCGLKKWLDQDIPLELHHEDGNSSSHRLSNLKLLCPNCHALTDNYRGKNNHESIHDDQE